MEQVSNPLFQHLIIHNTNEGDNNVEKSHHIDIDNKYDTSNKRKKSKKGAKKQ